MDDKQLLDAIRQILKDEARQVVHEEINRVLDAKLEPIKKDVQTIKHDVKEVAWKVDTLYDWVDSVDLKVNK